MGIAVFAARFFDIDYFDFRAPGFAARAFLMARTATTAFLTSRSFTTGEAFTVRTGAMPKW
jgi:hypothetical protein